MTGTVRILRGDARSLPLPDASVDLIVTSPPYFGLRSYVDNGGHYDGQIGSEATPAEYIAALLECTAEWMRVLKPSGSIFVNLGDKYAGSAGFASKSLLGLPWRYALGCVDDLGLILRAEIVWAKPNGLPESVTDRVRRSHEQVFHFTRQPRYYSAVDEVREAHTERRPSRDGISNPIGYRDVVAGLRLQQGAASGTEARHPLGKLPGSVWEIPSAPLTVPAHLGIDHFAAFPMELPRRIILGWSPSGICVECGEGQRPIAERSLTVNRRGRQVNVLDRPERGVDTQTLGWERVSRITGYGYACACPDATAPTRAALVVDPFGGTGTTALVASMLGRDAVTVDMSADYCRLAAWRTSDPGERARALGVPKPPPVPDGQGDLFEAVS